MFLVSHSFAYVQVGVSYLLAFTAVGMLAFFTVPQHPTALAAQRASKMDRAHVKGSTQLAAVSRSHRQSDEIRLQRARAQRGVRQGAGICVHTCIPYMYAYSRACCQACVRRFTVDLTLVRTPSAPRALGVQMTEKLDYDTVTVGPYGSYDAQVQKEFAC